MKIFNDALTLSATDLASTVTTSAVSTGLVQFTGFQMKISAAAGLSGTFSIQASLDEVADGSLVTNWAEVASQAVSSLSAPAVYIKTQTDNAYSFMRVVWNNSAGTGTLGEVRALGKAY